MDYVLEPQREMIEEELQNNFKLYGILPLCLACPFADDCIQYNAPGLTRMECRRGEWIRENGHWNRIKKNP